MLSTPLINRLPPTTVNSHPNHNHADAQSFPYNFFLCSFSLGKLLANVSVLLTDQNHHPDLRTWLELLTICDLVSTVLLVTEILHFIRTQPNRSRQDEESLVNHPHMTTLSEKKIFKTIIILNNCYYYILWSSGHYYYLKSCIDCSQSLQIIASLTFFYLYCGYFFIGCSFLTAVINKSFWGFLSFFPSNFASNTKSSAPVIVLPSKVYTSNMVGTAECYICLVSYYEGDKLSELPCNSKHHFHEACIMKWLKINNACPLCRKPVDKNSEAPTMNEIELPVIF